MAESTWGNCLSESKMASPKIAWGFDISVEIRETLILEPTKYGHQLKTYQDLENPMGGGNWSPASFIHLTNTYWMPVMCQGLLERLNVPIFRHFQPNHTAFPLKIRYDTSILWRKQSPQNLSDGPSRWQVYSLQEKRQTNQSQSSSGDRIYILWEPSILPFGLLQHL